MSYNVQYKHTDRSAIDRRIAGLQAELDELTPNEDGVVSYPCPDTAKLNEKIADLQAQLDDITPTEGEVYPCTDTAILNAKLDNIQEQIDNIEPDPDDPDDPTPDPEPTGDTTNYAEYCSTNLGGEWNENEQTCYFSYYNPEIGDYITLGYGTDAIDSKIACDNTPGSTWNYIERTCSSDPTPDPEPTGDTTNYEEYCTVNLGGEWNSETNICTFQINGMTYTYGTDTIDLKIACDSTPDSYWDYNIVSCCGPECLCFQQGGTWDPVNNECTYPEPDPEPTGDTTNYAEYCTVNLGGVWDESQDGCLVPYHDDELGDGTILYYPVEIDRKIECDNTPGSTWNMVNKTCTIEPGPEPDPE